MKKLFFLLLTVLPICMMGHNTFLIKDAAICYEKTESQQVRRAIADLQADIKQVIGDRKSVV